MVGTRFYASMQQAASKQHTAHVRLVTTVTHGIRIRTDVESCEF